MVHLLLQQHTNMYGDMITITGIKLNQYKMEYEMTMDALICIHT